VPEERQGEPAREPARATTAQAHAESASASRWAPPATLWASVRNQGVWDAVADLVQQRQSDLGRPLRVLDLGGGTGGLAVPLAELGHDVTVVDPSPNALAALERRAAEVGVAHRITARQGDADSVDTRLDTEEGDRAYDLACCHGVLEVVDDPAFALTGIADVLAPAGHLSLLVAGRLAVVLTKALAGDVAHATQALTSPDGRWGRGDPLPRRFDLAELRTLLEESGFEPLQLHGVRVFADLVPSTALDSASARAALADLELAVATHPHYADALGNLGAGLHAIAKRT
jgi:S-adenosylmethionine-dependent methyltransferase